MILLDGRNNMERLSRSVLKGIVKECIVEILQESFFAPEQSAMIQERNDTSTKNRRNKKRNTKKRMSLSESISTEESNSKMVRNESFDRKIDNIANNMTTDPVFADIFKDTANTTLQAQLGAESNRLSTMNIASQPGADKATILASQSDPTELFSESANKWAALAFSDSVK